MSVHVTVRQTIARDSSEVFAFAADYRNDTRWIGALERVELVTPPPFGVGSRVLRVAKFLGGKMEYVNEVTRIEPNTELAMQSVKAPFPMTVIYRFAPTAGGCEMSIETYGDATGFYKLATPLLNAAVRGGVSRDLSKLKAILEQTD